MPIAWLPPGSSTLINAAHVLGININTREIGLDDCSEERRVSILLALLAACITHYQITQDRVSDPLLYHSLDDLRNVVAGAEAQVADCDRVAVIDAMFWRIQTAGLMVKEVQEGSSYHGDLLMYLTYALIFVLRSWRKAHNTNDLGPDAHTHAGSGPDLRDQANALLQSIPKDPRISTATQ